MNNKPDKLLHVNIVAERLNLSVSTVRRLIRYGEISAYNCGAGKIPRYRVTESEITRFLTIRDCDNDYL